jgi:hypothetical protein
MSSRTRGEGIRGERSAVVKGAAVMRVMVLALVAMMMKSMLSMMSVMSVMSLINMMMFQAMVIR